MDFRKWAKRVVRSLWLRVGVAVFVLVYGVVYYLEQTKASDTDRFIELPDGRKLAYRVEGDGLANIVYFLHGAPANATSWDRVRSELPDSGYTYVFVDRLGYGNSSNQCETSLESHAESIISLARERGDVRPVLVGHSYGGPVALATSAIYADEVGGLVLVAGACDPGMEDSIWFRKLVTKISFVIPDSWANCNRELLALTDENRALSSKVERVTSPVAVLHGTWDPVCPFEGTANYLKTSLVRTEVEIIPFENRGHNLHLSEPQGVARAIVELVNSVGPSL